MKRVLLLGDSIRMGYMETVKAELAGKAEVVWPDENCRHTEAIVEKLDTWLAVEPDLIHLNAGLHDLKRMPDVRPGNFVPLDEYETNLRQVFQRITNAGIPLIWCTTTPVITERHSTVKSFHRFTEDVVAYNDVALRVAAEFDLPVHDLFQLVMDAGPEEWLSADGVHFTEAARIAQGKAVAAFVRQDI